MNRPSPVIWLALIFICLLPTAAGRFLLDIAGGLLLFLLAIPILLTGAGWLGWRFLQSRLTQCTVCGTSILSSAEECPICGADLSSQKKSGNQNISSESRSSIPASSATIDITAKDAD